MLLQLGHLAQARGHQAVEAHERARGGVLGLCGREGSGGGDCGSLHAVPRQIAQLPVAAVCAQQARAAAGLGVVGAGDAAHARAVEHGAVDVDAAKPGQHPVEHVGQAQLHVVEVGKRLLVGLHGPAGLQAAGDGALQHVVEVQAAPAVDHHGGAGQRACLDGGTHQAVRLADQAAALEAGRAVAVQVEEHRVDLAAALQLAAAVGEPVVRDVVAGGGRSRAHPQR